jgi:hypothetical protein
MVNKKRGKLVVDREALHLQMEARKWCMFNRITAQQVFNTR